MRSDDNRRVVRTEVVFLFLAVVGAAVSKAAAQTYLFGRADFAVGSDPLTLVSGDFNGDGILDLAVANAGSNTISILLGKPDGTFAPMIAYPTGSGPASIAIGDFNNDGILDLVVADDNCTVPEGSTFPTCGAGAVSILLGDGDGTFQAHVDYATGSGPESVTVGDFNGDGKLDLATANFQDNSVSVLLGNGDGTFQPHVDNAAAPGTSPSAIATADFNGDGRLTWPWRGHLYPCSTATEMGLFRVLSTIPDSAESP